MDIQTTLDKIRAGDRNAFAEIVTHYERPLFGFLGNMGLSYGQAQEIAQETLLRAWRHLGQYNPGLSGFSTWLFTIARNLAVDELRHARRRPDGNHFSNISTDAIEDELPEPAWDGHGPEESLVLARRRQALHNALMQLPIADRSVLALAYLSELDIGEIARIEQCTASAIKTRLHRARKRLAQLLTHLMENQDA